MSAQDQLTYNRAIASAAHARGLAVALKNDVDQAAALVGNFDLSVDEQCHELNECAKLQPFINAGKPVFNAEYTASNQAAQCATARQQQLRTLILPRLSTTRFA